MRLARIGRCSAALVVMTAVIAVPVVAEVLVTKRIRSNGIALLGQEASESTHELWIGDQLYADVGDGRSTILDIAAKRLLLVDHGSKTYSVATIPLDLASMMPPEAKPMIEMMLSGLTTEVTPTEEKREIGGWPTRKYLITVKSSVGMQVDIETWVTSESPIDMEAWKSISSELATAQPMMAEAVKSLLELDGFPILQEATIMMMGTEVKTSDEVLSIENKPAPEGTFSAPADYTERPFDPMGMVGAGG